MAFGEAHCQSKDGCLHQRPYGWARLIYPEKVKRGSCTGLIHLHKEHGLRVLAYRISKSSLIEVTLHTSSFVEETHVGHNAVVMLHIRGDQGDRFIYSRHGLRFGPCLPEYVGSV